MGNAERTHK